MLYLNNIFGTTKTDINVNGVREQWKCNILLKFKRTQNKSLIHNTKIFKTFKINKVAKNKPGILISIWAI